MKIKICEYGHWTLDPVIYFLELIYSILFKQDLSLQLQDIDFQKGLELTKEWVNISPKFPYRISSWDQSYKTFYGRNLRMFVISWSVCS